MCTVCVQVGDGWFFLGVQSGTVVSCIFVHCPVSGVGRLNGSLLGCLRKDVALCETASWAWGRGTVRLSGWDGTFHVHRLRASGGRLVLPELSCEGT